MFKIEDMSVEPLEEAVDGREIKVFIIIVEGSFFIIDGCITAVDDSFFTVIIIF